MKPFDTLNWNLNRASTICFHKISGEFTVPGVEKTPFVVCFSEISHNFENCASKIDDFMCSRWQNHVLILQVSLPLENASLACLIGSTKWCPAITKCLGAFSPNTNIAEPNQIRNAQKSMASSRNLYIYLLYNIFTYCNTQTASIATNQRAVCMRCLWQYQKVFTTVLPAQQQNKWAIYCVDNEHKKRLGPHYQPKVAVVVAMSVGCVFHMGKKIFLRFFSPSVFIIIEWELFCNLSHFNQNFRLASLTYSTEIPFFAFEKSLIYCLCKLKIFFLEYFICAFLSLELSLERSEFCKCFEEAKRLNTRRWNKRRNNEW